MICGWLQYLTTLSTAICSGRGMNMVIFNEWIRYRNTAVATYFLCVFVLSHHSHTETQND